MTTTNSNENEPMNGTKMKPLIKFAFGPFQVQGYEVSNFAIEKDWNLSQYGFQKIRIIKDFNKRTGLILFYHKERRSDVAIVFADKFPSWMWKSITNNTAVIIGKMQLVSSNGIITDDVPNHLANQSPAEIPKSYSITYPLLGGDRLTNLIETGNMVSFRCGCGFSEGESRYGYECALCHTKVELRLLTGLDKDYINQTGILVRTFTPPSSGIIDRDTPWNESITVCQNISSTSQCCSRYQIKYDTKSKYSCIFQDEGFVVEQDGGFTSVSNCLTAIGLGDPGSFFLENFLKTLKFPINNSRSIKMVYRALNAKVLNVIDDQYSNTYGEYGVELIPMSPTPVGNTSRIEGVGGSEITLRSWACFVAIPKQKSTPKFLSTVRALSTKSSSNIRLYFLSTYIVHKSGVLPVWYRSRLKLAWVIDRSSNSKGVISFSFYGILIRDRDEMWLAKTETIQYTKPTKPSDINMNLTEGKWVFNTNLLRKEISERKNPSGYIQGLRNIAETLGIDTSVLQV